MKRARKLRLVFGMALLVGSLAIAGPTLAGTWYSAAVGHLQYNDVADLTNGGPSRNYGMDLYLNTARTVDVLYSIPGSTYDWPVFFQHKVRWIRVNTRLYSADVRIVYLALYDGNTLLSSVNWGWDAGWKNGTHDIYWDAGADFDIKKGLRLVVRIQSGVEAVSHNCEIWSVSARVD